MPAPTPIDTDEFLLLSPDERRAYFEAGGVPPDGWGDSGAATELLELFDGCAPDPEAPYFDRATGKFVQPNKGT